MLTSHKSFIRHEGKFGAWFHSSSQTKITSPPDLTSRTDLEIGDVFAHKVGETRQLWIWSTKPNGTRYWKSVSVGYKREDGRRLILTNVRLHPSWVSETWYKKLDR